MRGTEKNAGRKAREKECVPVSEKIEINQKREKPNASRKRQPTDSKMEREGERRGHGTNKGK